MDNKMWCIHTMEYRLVIKRNEVLMHATTSMKTLCYMKEASHKMSYLIEFSSYEISRIGKSRPRERRFGVIPAWGNWGKWKVTDEGYMVSFGGS